MRVVQFFRMHKVVAGVVFVDLIIVIVLVALAIIKGMKTATVDILVAPSVATVEINGAKYGTGAYRLFPGEAEATISADGFETKTMALNLKAGETTKLYVYLNPNEDSLNYYARNSADAELLKKVGGMDITKIISIQDILPITSRRYNETNGSMEGIVINQNLDCEEIFCLRVIGDSSNGHEWTRSLIKERGYNPDDYEIRY